VINSIVLSTHLPVDSKIGDSERCPECEGIIVRKGAELYCSVCGLVVGYESFIPRTPLQSSSPLKNLDEFEERVLAFLDHYTNGLPKFVKERARYVALKAIRSGIDPERKYAESLALAVAHAVAREIGKSVASKDMPKVLKKTARGFVRSLLSLGLVKPVSPREMFLKEVEKECSSWGIDPKKAWGLFLKMEKNLSKHKPEVAAKILCTAVCLQDPSKITNPTAMKRWGKVAREYLKDCTD